MSLDFFDGIAKEYGVLSLIVRKDGQEIARKNWDDEMRRNQYSASKSFTSCAVGIAVREGLLSLEEPLSAAFSQDMPDAPCEALEKATVRDLLTMCLGQQDALLMGEQRPFLREDDWVRYCLAQPFSAQPGEVFRYSNVGPYLAGILVQRRCGCNLVQYLMPRLFAPLGIRLPTWETDPQGQTFGAGGLFLCATELSLFGELLLQKGMWQGRSLVPAEYLEEATKKQVENGGEGYGYLFWRGPRNSYRADGKYGQFAIVLPEDNAVLTINAECRNASGLLQHLFENVDRFLG